MPNRTYRYYVGKHKAGQPKDLNPKIFRDFRSAMRQLRLDVQKSHELMREQFPNSLPIEQIIANNNNSLLKITYQPPKSFYFIVGEISHWIEKK